MSVLRFLQARPYWLYKVAAVLVVLADLLMLGNVFTAANEVILYPVITSLLPASMVLLVAALLAFLGESVVFVTRRPRNSFTRHVSLALPIALFVIASLAIIAPQIQGPRTHIRSVAHNDHLYNVAQDGWGLVNFTTTIPAALYECDRFGVFCRVVGKFDLVTDIWIPAPHRQTVIELAADTVANTIVVRVDGEVAYTYAV